MSLTFAESVRVASARGEVRDAIREIYLVLQSRLDVRRPICQTSGRCCRFDEFGHRLFVTTAEMATFVYEQIPPKPSANRLAVLAGCPYQVDGLCSVHETRPFGCRIFFCDESSTEWQREQYEILHQEIQAIHQRLEVPYFYMEWREALAAMGWERRPGSAA